ncbi:MAG TPA: hypothetical protein PLS16_04675 [Chitinophagales bacterium]|nr:hypothetical protein [Chitinophagales bacterium]
MRNRAIFGKAVWLSFAKAKEKQRHPQAKASCFTFAFAQTHNDITTIIFNINQDI